MVRGAVIIAVAMSWAGYSYAGDNSTIDQTIAAAGKTSDTSFCGSKPIVLGIHDGWGIWGWSKASMAASSAKLSFSDACPSSITCSTSR